MSEFEMKGGINYWVQFLSQHLLCVAIEFDYLLMNISAKSFKISEKSNSPVDQINIEY